MEGFVRPAACDAENPEWLPPNTFFAREVMFDSDSTCMIPHIRRIADQTWKYGGMEMETNCPICLIGQAFARQIHIKTTQGGGLCRPCFGFMS